MDTSLSITAQPTPQRARNEGVDAARHQHGHERRAERRSERREEREDRREAFADLKLKITQTLYGTPAQATQAVAANASPAVLVGASTDPVSAPADTPIDSPIDTPTTGSGLLSLRLRLAYTSFDSQPQAAVAGAADAHPNLASFLKSLAQSFGGGQPATPAVDTSSAPAAPAVSGSLSIRFSAAMRYEQTACNSQPALAVA